MTAPVKEGEDYVVVAVSALESPLGPPFPLSLEQILDLPKEQPPLGNRFIKPTPTMLQHRFSFHPLKADQGERYEAVRDAILTAAVTCVAETPCSPEQTRALDALDEAMFLFNAAIARGE